MTKRKAITLLTLSIAAIAIAGTAMAFESQTHRPSSQLLQKAQEQLECDSEEACREACNKTENTRTCMRIAIKHGPHEYRTFLSQTLNYAQQELGCSTIPSCHTFCQNPENHLQCMEFTHTYLSSLLTKHQTSLLEDIFSRLPCASYESCTRYCLAPENDRQCKTAIQQSTRKNTSPQEHVESPPAQAEQYTPTRPNQHTPIKDAAPPTPIR